MSKPIFEKSSALQSHLLKQRSLQFEIKVGLAGEFVESGIGTIEIVNAANGTSTLTLSKDTVGDVSRVKSVELISTGAATITASASVVSDSISIALDSNTDYTAADDTIEIRVVYKLK